MNEAMPRYERNDASPWRGEPAYDYAARLTEAIHQRWWPEQTEWQVESTLIGVLLQLDNMICGMERRGAKSP